MAKVHIRVPSVSTTGKSEQCGEIKLSSEQHVLEGEISGLEGQPALSEYGTWIGGPNKQFVAEHWTEILCAYSDHDRSTDPTLTAATERGAMQVPLSQVGVRKVFLPPGAKASFDGTLVYRIVQRDRT